MKRSLEKNIQYMKIPRGFSMTNHLKTHPYLEEIIVIKTNIYIFGIF